MPPRRLSARTGRPRHRPQARETADATLRAWLVLRNRHQPSVHLQIGGHLRSAHCSSAHPARAHATGTGGLRRMVTDERRDHHLSSDRGRPQGRGSSRSSSRPWPPNGRGFSPLAPVGNLSALLYESPNIAFPRPERTMTAVMVLMGLPWAAEPTLLQDQPHRRTAALEHCAVGESAAQPDPAKPVTPNA